MKILVGEDNRILGFAILGAQVGEVMSLVQMAMLGELTYAVLGDAILADPTLAEGRNLFFSGVSMNKMRDKATRDVRCHRRCVGLPRALD